MFKIRCKYMFQLTNIILELDNQFTVISIVIPAKLKMRISDPPPPPIFSTNEYKSKTYRRKYCTNSENINMCVKKVQADFKTMRIEFSQKFDCLYLVIYLAQMFKKKLLAH